MRARSCSAGSPAECSLVIFLTSSCYLPNMGFSHFADEQLSHVWGNGKLLKSRAVHIVSVKVSERLLVNLQWILTFGQMG